MIKVIILFFVELILVSSGIASAEQIDYGPEPYGPYQLEERWGVYESETAEGTIRYLVVKPKGPQSYPGVYYIYGRPGLDNRLMPEIRRLASFGFTVFVSHVQEAFMVPILLPVPDPPEFLPAQREGFQAFLKIKERSPGKVCLVGSGRGGQYALHLATDPAVACYAGFSPVLTDPSQTEQHQDIMLAPEIRNLKVPTLLMVGDWDFEARVNPSIRAEQYLKMHGVPVELAIYPEARRAFEFRTVRSLADDLAKIDSMNRMVAFFSKYLGIGDPNLEMDSNEYAPIPALAKELPQLKVAKRPRIMSKSSAVAKEDGN